MVAEPVDQGRAPREGGAWTDRARWPHNCRSACICCSSWQRLRAHLHGTSVGMRPSRRELHSLASCGPSCRRPGAWHGPLCPRSGSTSPARALRTKPTCRTWWAPGCSSCWCRASGSPALCALQGCLKAAILDRDGATAAAILFLSDRLLYGLDASHQLLRVAKALHRRWPATPMAPQLLIRQARVALNAGKLLKAEYILSSLIHNEGAAGSWLYRHESDRVLVQSVCLQVRGQILQKLGMWSEAAELLWASMVGFLALPLPDKKGVSASLGILADVCMSMSEQDYEKFTNHPHVALGLARDCAHRLLLAAEACKLAATFSPYTPLFVLTAMNIRGACLLSYASVGACPPGMRPAYLREAREAFEIGLLTQHGDEPVPGRQGLHSVLRAALGLCTAHRRLHGDTGPGRTARRLCREALGTLYAAGVAGAAPGRAALSREILRGVARVKGLLRVRGCPRRIAGACVPAGFLRGRDRPLLLGSVAFPAVLRAHAQHHSSVCGAFESVCGNKRNEQKDPGTGVCIVALKTDTRGPDAESAEGRPCLPPGGALSAPGAAEEGLEAPQRAGRSGWVRTDTDTDTDTDMDTLRASLGPGLAPEAAARGHGRGNAVPRGSRSAGPWGGLSGRSWEETDIHVDSRSPGHMPGRGRPVDTRGSSARAGGPGSPGDGAAVRALSSELRGLSSPVLVDGPSASSWSHSPSATCPPGSTAGAHVPSGAGLAEGGPEARRAPGGASAQARPSLGSAFASSGCRWPPRVATRPSFQEETFEMMDECPAAGGDAAHGSGEELGAGRMRAAGPAWKGSPSWGTPEEAADSPRALGGSLGAGSAVARHTATSPWPGPRLESAHSGGPSHEQEVDPEASTVDEGGQLLEPTRPHRCPGPCTPRLPPASRSHEACATTEEGSEPTQVLGLSGSGSTSSSGGSWRRPPTASSGSSEGSKPWSFLNSSGGSFMPLAGETRQEMLKARTLQPHDLERLLAGVTHDWLLQRMEGTGLFRPCQLHQAYDALLLKYSKKSEVWTAQETAVYLGDYLKVTKAGRQRNAFWVHYLHQEETLGRYVGKAYREPKALRLHFCDVARQGAAQHYVTEFNKRLFEQKIPTQLFYVPSAALLILEDQMIKGCVSVEPYIQGEFVKLSNNTKVVKTEYKATEFGLAFGHFSYEFSSGQEVVVDLQGWVTSDGKGLLYLTDPQIHSLGRREVTSNFGERGISYFFDHQHAQCNDICRRLSLTRPPTETRSSP